MTTIHQWRWFFAWQDDKEEQWLREMALAGWHFRDVSPFGKYTFEQGAPRNDVYRLDFFRRDMNKAEYLQLFQDAGWAYVGELSRWQYFRKTVADDLDPAASDLPDIFSDNESKAAKYRRILLILVALLPIYLNAIITIARQQNSATSVYSIVMIVFLFFYTYAIIRLIMRVRQLTKKL